MEGLDERTESILRAYLRDVLPLRNEAAKTHRFCALVEALFPGTKAVPEFSAGVEKRLRIEIDGKSSNRRIDAYYGNAVIEFENSLKATEDTAREQLCEYSAGLWATEGKPYRPLLCVASDGVTWKTYNPVLGGSGRTKPRAEDVRLESLQTITLSDESFREFWLWLTSLLFRDARTVPTPERFQLDFGAASLAFADAIRALSRAWESCKDSREPSIAFETWQKYLAVTYGRLGSDKDEGNTEKDLLTLFLKHTYLASLARLLIWASLSGGRAGGSLSETAQTVLSGEYFRARGIENLVEDDFFQWVRRAKAAGILAPVWERILAEMQTYDLSRLSQDVLKGVYQELVDPQDRHDLGEYYTPEWLCEHVVGELLPKKGYAAVLDPTCGSGSFLRAAIAHFLAANEKDTPQAKLKAILGHVAGIDIHPLAVTIARATYVLALRELLKTAGRPIQVPVYLADALFLPSEVTQGDMFGSQGGRFGYKIRLGKDRAVLIPASLVRDAELFDPAIAACASVARDHAESSKENQTTLTRYLERAVPGVISGKDASEILRALWRFTEELADLIRQEENSIWAFIVRNAYRPAMLRDRFDFIVGNPPWLSYRYIADPEYQAEVKKRAIDEYAIAPKAQKLFTQMELATVFLVHTLTTFGREGARLGFVMPRSVLSAEQHRSFRDRTYKAPLVLEKYDDLFGVTPVFNVPACLIYARKLKEYPRPSESYSLPVVSWQGRLPQRDLSWAEASEHLVREDDVAQLLHLGSLTALGTKKAGAKGKAASAYRERFRQGATIVPRNCYFVIVDNAGAKIDPDRLYWVETDPEQAESAKPPYDKVRMKGHVEGRFLFSSAVAKHLLPFAIAAVASIVLPAIEKQGSLRLLTAQDLKKEGYRAIGKWMDEVETVWKAKRKEKAGKQTVYQRLDYNKELSHQTLGWRYLALYNAAGKNLSAAVLDRQDIKLPFVVEHKLYWCGCDTEEEADYIVAVLNSSVVNEVIKPFQSVGLMGERDIEKKVLEIPIPLFDTRREEHRALARLGASARHVARAFVDSSAPGKSLAARREQVRQTAGEVLSNIDLAVRKLFY